MENADNEPKIEYTTGKLSPQTGEVTLGLALILDAIEKAHADPAKVKRVLSKIFDQEFGIKRKDDIKAIKAQLAAIQGLDIERDELPPYGIKVKISTPPKDPLVKPNEPRNLNLGENKEAVDDLKKLLSLIKRTDKIYIVTNTKVPRITGYFTAIWDKLLRAMGYKDTITMVGYDYLDNARTNNPVILPIGMNTHHNSWNRNDHDITLINIRPNLLLNIVAHHPDQYRI